MTEFHLATLIRETLEDSANPDLDIVTRKVLTSIAEGDRYEALRQALSELIPSHATRLRVAAMNAVAHSDEADEEKPKQGVSVSPKWQHASLVSRMLASTLPVERGRILMSDATAEDLEFAASRRDDLARANMLAAERFRRLAKAVVESGVDRLGEVPADLIEEAMQGGGV